jgi:transposase
MAQVQKTYTAELKREAVRLAQTSGKPIAQVARELGISDTSIHEWRKQVAAHGDEAFPGSGHQTAKAGGTPTPQTRTGGDAAGAIHFKTVGAIVTCEEPGSSAPPGGPSTVEDGAGSESG